jgi:hypothetical protein
MWCTNSIIPPIGPIVHVQEMLYSDHAVSMDMCTLTVNRFGKDFYGMSFIHNSPNIKSCNFKTFK